jgi:hypothetical protein
MARGVPSSVRARAGVLVAVAALLAQGSSASPAGADVGHRGHSFSAASVDDPSGQKPQSKLWFNDGLWWGSLFAKSIEEFTIHRLDPATQTWVDTGTSLDARNDSEADTLFDGGRLYVASSSDRSADIRLTRFTYDPGAKAYQRDAGFPITLPAGPVESVVLDQDSSGRLWITYTSGSKVHVTHTTNDHTSWIAPYVLPVSGASNLSADDISALVSFDGRIGVMWSNQTDQKIYFAQHIDGEPESQWHLGVALQGDRAADDHINLKSLQADVAGRVFAAVKTSKGDDTPPAGMADQVDLLVLDGLGGWTSHVFGTVEDDHTRPIVLTNQATRRLYVVATSPASSGAGVQTIYYKESSLDDPSFPPGAGTVLMQSSAGLDINDPTSTKQDLSTAPGIVVLASDPTNYWHNTLQQGSPLGGTPGSGASEPGSDGSASPDRVAPVIGRLAVRPRVFRKARGPRRAGARRAAWVRYDISETAVVRFKVLRAVSGRRVRGRCARRTRTNRSRRVCTRFVRVRGSIVHRANPGFNRLRFNGRMARRALVPDRYRLVAIAADSARNVSRPRSAAFRIRR